MVESIRQAPCPQLAFRTSLAHLIDDRHLIFTDASRRESGDFVGIGVHSLSLYIQEMLKIDYNSSVFSGKCIAVIRNVSLRVGSIK